MSFECDGPAVTSTSAYCFNPHPSLLTGESAQQWAALPALVGGFNPHPSLLTGESRQGVNVITDELEVSIHTRHC